MPNRIAKPRTPVTTVIGVIVILLAHYLGILEPLETLTRRAFQPVGRYFITRINHNGRQSPITDAELRSNLSNLEEQNAKLSEENVQLKTALGIKSEVSAQSQFLTERRLSGVVGLIYARNSNPNSEYVVIDIGSNKGIAVGAPAVIGEGIVVGRVIEVDSNSSKVLLSTDNRSSFAGMLIDNPTAQGEVIGIRGLSLKMNLVPQSELLTTRQLVVTSGIDPQVQPKLLLGTIDRVDKQEGAILQSATVRPLYNPFRLEAVTILTTQ